MGIKPIQVERLYERPLSCVDDILLTLGKWKNTEIEYNFISRWNFQMVSKNTNAIGELLQNDSSIYNNIESGIKLSYHQKTSFLEMLSFIENEIIKEVPVMAVFDAYYCPWDKFYKQYHNKHLCLIVGIDKIMKELYITDPYELIYEAKIGFQDFEAGYSEYYSIEIEDGYKNDEIVNYSNILKELEKSKDMIKNIHQFAYYLGNSFNPQNELDLSDHFYGTKLYTQLNIIIWNRWTFSILLFKLASKNSELLLEIAKELSIIAFYWNNVKLMIAKTFYLMNWKSYVLKIESKVHDIACKEEDTYKKLYEICLGKEDNTRINNKQINFVSNNYKMDILYYLNNKGIMNEFGEADLTGNHEYFKFSSLTDVIDKGITLDKSFDNITCNGQTIIIKENYVKSITFLACSEWGSYNEIIYINSSSGDEKKISFNVPDLCTNVNNNLLIALKGKTYERVGCNEFLKQSEAYIFNIKCNIDQVINSFKLPLCPNIHVFAIQIEENGLI